ncbi:Chitin binding Peritrophin-A domain containing protein 10-like protein [Leptotrombidium deliense]|uniref:Chitin binding Peritrophin-A domain containing protein 10-like protein n=1 Tax=Leptotrombidium deliense TaxID=299467 RepID=A0A443SVV7_9ACAR|nr:Chitin binding Peritrophin-A domain containing protein 10-like protein [Leptotrombidium deliense]
MDCLQILTLVNVFTFAEQGTHTLKHAHLRSTLTTDLNSTAQLACGPVNDEESQLPKDLKQSNNPVCNRETCRLPNCYCSEDGTAIPGGLNPDQVPQMVLLAFSGAVNELVFEQYKKVLGYNNKFVTTQSKLNPNGCGVKATFFINHEYSNYAEIQWLATQGHEIGIHSITHRLPELWWTDKANYSEWAEEIIGMREILLKFANGGATTNGVLSRENVVGMRAPYVKPGGDAMFEMAHDFGLLYDSSLVAPRGNTPLWPFTFDHRQPFSCGESPNKPENGKDASETSSGTENAGIGFRGGAEIRQKRDTLVESKLSKKKVTQVMKKNLNRKSRVRRENPFLGRPLKCPLKSFPGLWEVPVNPLFNEFNTCPHADQCVFPSSDETEDPSDIVEFLNENFQRHYSSNRAPFQVNFHVNWFTSKTKVKALSRFIEHILKTYKDAYFVTFRQMIQWMKEPQPLSTLNFKCENRTNVSTCNRQHTCVLKHFVDKDGVASTQEASVASDVRYMGVCHPTTCPQHYPWYGNHAGAARNLKTVMQLVEEAVGPDEKNS